MRKVPKWKTLAASTASAPASTAGAKCASVPAPPLAITGTVTTSRTARISSVSKPAVVPSASIEFSRISPAPSSVAQRVQRLPPAAGPGRPAGPADRVDAGADPAAVRGHLEAARRGGSAPSVHGQHYALRPESLRRLGQQFWPGDGGRVERDLVRPGPQ